MECATGFVDHGEAHHQAARREFAEETGLKATALTVTPLEGEPANPNSAFFETMGADEGVHFYGVELDQQDLELRNGDLVVRDTLLERAPRATSERFAEMISGLHFIHWTKAARLQDMLTNAAVSRLQGYLRLAR